MASVENIKYQGLAVLQNGHSLLGVKMVSYWRNRKLIFLGVRFLGAFPKQNKLLKIENLNYFLACIA